METYLLLFRGINVGGKNKLPMKILTHILETLGYHNIQTYIQSGNVILQSEFPPDREAIKEQIERKQGFRPDMILLNAAQWIDAHRQNPYPNADGKTVHFYFCQETPQINDGKIEKYRAESESYRLIGQVFYLFAPDGIGRFKLGANLEVSLGTAITGRNLNTINRLHMMLESK